jgi:hypothetical protein
MECKYGRLLKLFIKDNLLLTSQVKNYESKYI